MEVVTVFHATGRYKKKMTETHCGKTMMDGWRKSLLDFLALKKRKNKKIEGDSLPEDGVTKPNTTGPPR